MTASFSFWTEYILRFAHLVAGISWIGSSFYFIWLDSSFESPEVPRRNVEGELFMVHGGFYYQVEKRKIYPGELPKILHWFKWEATLTWITGVFLLVYMYYLNGASLLIDKNVSSLSQGSAVMLSLGLVVISWTVYDLIWNVKVISNKSISSILSILGFGGLIYLNTHLFSGRGAFIQTGAILGTLMLANVWMRILPGQKKMIKDAEAGKIPDYSLSAKSKVRSVHNTYFIFPVLFIMLSNHYPQLYNHKLNWVLLIILSVSGAMVRHAMVTKIPKQRWTLLPAAIGMLALIYFTAVPESTNTSSGRTITFEEVKPIFQNRCITCHSSHPTDDIFKEAPKGVYLETEEQILSIKEKVLQQVVVGKTMPLANKTGMLDSERDAIRDWLSSK